MPRLVKEKAIQGVSYRVTPLGASSGTMLLFRVGRIAAGFLEGAPGFVAALQQMPPEEFAWAMGILQGTTQVGIVDTKGDGRVTWVPLAQVYDDHFAANYEAWTEWALFAAETSIGSFFAEALGAFRVKRAPSPSSSPPVATGGSGDSLSTPG